ncbi:MAG: ribbon-helix-helix protein, CopG family [Chloroflexi bacterium]|nr:ribbon-helix-helix protein, CopG family [Chloroflexota bacterium]MBI4505039.1 ribbon-helix-helix protein, CopG family [Chloroflexota bacterium]
MLRTQVQLTEEQLARLRALARRDGSSVAEVVRRAVDHFITEDEAERQRHRAERLLSIVGRFSSGLGDLAERHDDYFAEDEG